MKKKLAKFLASDKRPEGTMSLTELYGFLFAICAAPEPVQTQEWIEVVFNGGDPRYKSEDKKVKIEAALVSAFEEVSEQVHSDQPLLPKCCKVLSPPMENFEEISSLAYWADGFFDGYDWLSDVWHSSIKGDLRVTVNSAVTSMVYFSHREGAREFCAKSLNQHLSKAHWAQVSVDKLPSAMATYARIGRTLAHTFTHKEPVVKEIKLGRNEPCYCGSGLKYKRCCMNA